MYDREKKILPIGIENFEEIRTEDYYYVDKTALIGELIHRRGKVNLFTRPRRFGKSLNMSMLKSFFRIGCDKSIFEGLAIEEEETVCEKYMGKFPVISVSLKSANALDYETARALMCSIIGNEAMRFYELADSDRLTDEEKKRYRQLIEVDETGQSIYAMSDAVLMGSLKTLSILLEKHYGQKTVILIDEYDVPLAKANDQGYYDSMIMLIRNMFEQALKTNDSLQMAVLTGCLTKRGEAEENGLRLVIPNREIHNIFMTQIRGWMQKKIREDRERLDAFCRAFRDADGERAQSIFTEFLYETVSVRDTAVRKDLKENFYHGFLLGLLRFQENWKVLSNRESGKGYADIVVEIFSEKTAIVIEMKYAENGDLEAACEEALRQIEREGYAEGPHLDGMDRVIKCGMACHVKRCRVVFA